MRALELAKVAAAAEALRLKRYARRQGIRIALAAGAAVFLLALIIMVHVLAVVLLAMVVHLWLAVLIVLVVDLVIGGVLGALALSNKPDRIELEAAAVRRQSLIEAKTAATSLATLGEVAGLAIGMTGRRRAQSSKIGKAWMIADLASRFVRRR
jgi:hypothetical protein